MLVIHDQKPLKSLSIASQKPICITQKTQKEQFRQFVLDLGSGDAALSGGGRGGWQKLSSGSSGAGDPGPVLAAVAAARGGAAKGMMAYVGTSQLKTKIKVRVQAGTALDYLLCTSATRSGRGTPSDLVAATGGEFGKSIVDAMKRCLFGGAAIGLILPSPPPQSEKCCPRHTSLQCFK